MCLKAGYEVDHAVVVVVVLCRLATSAWMAGLTPGSVIRGLGPWGPNLIDKYVNGRFSVHGKHI
jgi:hypothetical protein